MEQRRVVHVVPALFGRGDGIVGGAERFALELARHMAMRVPTTLVTFGRDTRDEALGDLRIRVLGPALQIGGQRSNPITLSLFGELGRAGVLHCHQQHVVASSATSLFGRVAHRPVFVTDLGSGGWDISSYVSTDRWYTGHLHISEYSRRIAGHEGKPWATVIFGGVDTAKFSPAPSAGPRDTVLFVGRLLPHKGVDDLVTAVPDDQPLAIIGPAPDERYLSDLHRLADGKQVHFRHDCSDEELTEAYRRARCVVLPSVYRTMYGDQTQVPELLGQALLEGMACGAPGIGTSVASLPEVVEDGATGFIVPPNAPGVLRGKLAWLREHPDGARAMGDAARRRVLEQFTWDRVVGRCLDAYAAEAPTRGAPR